MANLLRRALGESRSRERTVFRGMVVAFIVTLVLLSASGLYLTMRTQELAAHADSISNNALPSVVHLTAIRRELGRTQSAVERTLYEGGAWDPTIIPRSLDVIALATEHYRETADYVGEAALWTSTNRSLADARGALLMLDAALVKNSPDAGPLFRDMVRPRTEELHRKLGQLIELNAENAAIAARQVNTARARVRWLSLGLAFLSLVSSLGAVLLFGRYTRFVERRAEELESFAGRVAHDIRGPLAPALFALETLSHATDTATQRRAERGAQSLGRVVAMLEDLYAFARGGARPVAGAVASVAEVMNGVRDDVDALATEKTATLDMNVEESVRVACAPGVLATILSNLVRNGVKYLGDADERRVSVRAWTRRAHVVIEVSDTGPGVPRALEHDIFQPYVRGPDRREGGIGLGLATVKRLVEAHGGHVELARHARHCGATFVVSLPVAQNAAIKPSAVVSW